MSCDTRKRERVVLKQASRPAKTGALDARLHLCVLFLVLTLQSAVRTQSFLGSLAGLGPERRAAPLRTYDYAYADFLDILSHT